MRLRFEGVDHTAHVFLNGEPLGEHAGMLLPFEFDVTERLRPGEPNRLLVVVEHAPDEQGQIGWTSRVRHWKARFAYGWDWCTRLVPLGIWDRVSLRATGAGVAARRRDPHQPLRSTARRRRSPSSSSSALPGSVPTGGAGRWSRIEILQGGLPVGAGSRTRSRVFEDTSLVQSLTLRGARPLVAERDGGAAAVRGAGEPALAGTATLLDGRVIPFGIRQVAALPNEGAPEATVRCQARCRIPWR